MAAPATWTQLLEDALEQPGRVASCYKAFHNYIFGNQLLAMWQCKARGLDVGPMATYNAWAAKGRQVRKGEKSLVLCVPVMATRIDEETGDKHKFLAGFTYKASWFVVGQTDGDDATLPAVPGFDWDQVCCTLGINRIPYDMADGNCQGFSDGNGNVALSPVAAHPARTMLHEMAHALLHSGDCAIEHDVRELEAEAVAYLISATFGLPGLDESRGYMQHWYGTGRPVEEATANRIFGAVQKILTAGTKEEK